MKIKKLYFIFFILLILTSCTTTTSTITTTITTSTTTQTTTTVTTKNETKLSIINNEVFRFSTIYDKVTEDGSVAYKMIVPYDDTYRVSVKDAKKAQVYDEELNLLGEGISYTLDLKKDQIVYLNIFNTPDSFFTINIKLKKNLTKLPYDINSTVDMSSFSTESADPNVDPLQPAQVKYTKRQDGKGLYINSNNPERLTKKQLNTALTREDVTDKQVFFTFEHHIIDSPHYFGYRVTNTSNEDVFITVNNLGYHVDGPGSWLGQDEWIKFYNINFETKTRNYTQAQMDNFIAYVNFTGDYKSEYRQPITYRIPKGEYIYVMGGTTKDSYQNINVFNSADIILNYGCGNGAVLFDVTGGTAEGAFLIYDDEDAKTINNSKYVKNKEIYGHVNMDDNFQYGSQYAGYDNCHGVVDSDLTWTFNDKTPAQTLPVSYENKYYKPYAAGTPYSKITDFQTIIFNNVDFWATHFNPNNNKTVIGTDMTNYITKDHLTQQDVILGYEYFDGRGENANIGNWMIDYIDTFTLVNQGDSDRTFTYNLYHYGVILAFVRDENGFVNTKYTPQYQVAINYSSYGDAIYNYFSYSVTVPAHSIVRFSVDYNLCANSTGYIKHEAILK